MAKKERIVIRKDEDLESIDTELDAALSNLDVVVQKVGGLLDAMESENLQVGQGSEMDEDGEIVVQASAAPTATEAGGEPAPTGAQD